MERQAAFGLVVVNELEVFDCNSQRRAVRIEAPCICLAEMRFVVAASGSS